MDTIKLMQEKNRLYLKLSDFLSDLEKHLYRYMSIFEIKDFYSFSSSEEKRDFYKNEYRELASRIALPSREISAITSVLSSLIVEADGAMDDELSLSLNALFTECMRFEKRLSEFNSQTSRILSKEPISPGALLDNAKKLDISLRSLKSLLI